MHPPPRGGASTAARAVGRCRRIEANRPHRIPDAPHPRSLRRARPGGPCGRRSTSSPAPYRPVFPGPRSGARIRTRRGGKGVHRRLLWVARPRPAPPGPGPPAAPRNDGAGGGTDRPLPPCAIVPARRWAPGAWPKKRPQGTRDAAGTQVSASQRAGSDPRGARGIGRAWSPAGAVFLVAASVRRPGPAPACQAVSGEAHAPPEPAITLRGLPAVRPPRRGRIRRMRRVGPEAGRRGGISAPAGPRAARSHARHRDTPRTGHAARGDGG
ncbi:hypothetical protein JOE48_001095 [Methylobacterium sp. PvR107]|nr:hypothetical protein [Methylobacterium sp. PvR107]